MNITQKNKELKMKKLRKGFFTMELALVLLIVGGIIAVGVYQYSKLDMPTKAKEEVQKISTIITGIKRAKDDYNNGTYPASSKKAINAIVNLKLALGGTSATNALGSWNYSCTAGNNSVVTVETNDYPDSELQDAIIVQSNTLHPSWVATKTGKKVQLKRSNSVCK